MNIIQHIKIITPDLEEVETFLREVIYPAEVTFADTWGNPWPDTAAG